MHLFGRAHEYWVIRQQLRDVDQGRSGLILLDGPKGSGKTALVNHLSGTAKRCGFEVLGGSVDRYRKLLLAASMAGGGACFQPFSGISGQEAATWYPDLLADQFGAELDDRPGGNTRGANGSAARPVLIALDDVSWHDVDVRCALLGLPSADSPRRVLWLFSGAGAPGPLGAPASPDAIRLTLGPLGAGEAARMAADRLGGVPDADLGRLVDACGGHPALLAGVLDTLIACGGHVVRSGVAGPAAGRLPRPVLTGLLEQDPRLSARTRALATAVAAQPDRVRVSELMRLPTEIAVPLLGAVREATGAGVLTVDGDRLRFRHPLVRQAAALLPSRPAELLGVLSQQLAPATALATVRQAVRGGRIGPPEARTGDGAEPNPLSPAEHNIVRLVADGLTDRQIASRVNLSPHTVNFHLRKIFRKLGVSSRAELVGAHFRLLHTRDEPRTLPPRQESRTADAG